MAFVEHQEPLVQFSQDGKMLLRYPKEATQRTYTIPQGVTYIGDDAFASCENLEEVILPEGVQFLGRRAFQRCIRLGKVVLPNSLVGIKTRAFAGCYALKTLSLPGNLHWFEAHAFDGCGCLQRSGREVYVDGYLVETHDSATFDAPHGEYQTFDCVTYHSMGNPPENRRDEDMHSEGYLDYWGQPIR